ncbi:SusD/RagB family nutrient-binding outer membrane lipoprotein [Galbibacter sp. BG1]|uniref:SusD/RagB family nutrient-binding outer membrane lipoprotein n=1 Tax=Galbibacter sp. BG1 TaxID=1170699 RepID=UPI0015C07C4A|nr:SusD/RagB family nutrient-binding outer membrane lipoprotein [Galbibacter sp. BG1]QLE00560.1 SusD/RagB family nutrient-binding outer membrane lipoprotein [Galbibacter sp. BG1]
MKNIRFLAYTLIVCLGIGSCTSFVEDINDDPNRPVDAPSIKLVQGVILSNQFWQSAEAARLGMIWLNQASGSDRQYIALNDWNATPATNFDDTWNEAYVGTIAQSQILQEKAAAAVNPNLVGMAQVLEANAFGTLTSLFGDIPFSEANNPEFTNPTYESQTTVYAGVQAILDEAIANLSANDVLGLPSEDIVYDGDTSKWIALAYTLKARYYLHVGDYASAISAAQNGIMDADGDYKSRYGTVFGASFNPYYDFLVYNRPGYMSAIDSYGAQLLDPATGLYRGNAKTDESARFAFNYIKGANWYNAGYELNFYSQYDWGTADGKFGTESDMPLATYGENLQIIAESQARLNGFAAGLAAYNDYRALLNTGYSIGLNNDGYADWGDPFMYDAYTAADFATGGIENPDGVDQLEALLSEIAEERYVYFIGSFEAFVDFNRTDNAAGVTLKNFNGNAERFIYPQVEINGNSSVPSPLPSVLEPTPVNQ